MLPKYIFPYLFADTLFVATGGLLVAVILISKSAMNVPTTDDVAPNLLLAHAPLNGELSSLYNIHVRGRLKLKSNLWRCLGRCWPYLRHLRDFLASARPRQR